MTYKKYIKMRKQIWSFASDFFQLKENPSQPGAINGKGKW